MGTFLKTRKPRRLERVFVVNIQNAILLFFFWLFFFRLNSEKIAKHLLACLLTGTGLVAGITEVYVF